MSIITPQALENSDLYDKQFQDYAITQSGNYISYGPGAGNANSVKQEVEATPQSSIPGSALLNGAGSQIQVQITPGLGVDSIKNMYVRMTVQNTHTTEYLGLVPMPFWFDHITISANTVEVDTIFPQHLWNSYCMFTRWSQSQKSAFAMGISPETFLPTGNSYADQSKNSAIAPSSSKDFFMRLPSLLEKMPIGLMQEKICFRINFFFSSLGSGLNDSTNLIGTNAGVASSNVTFFALEYIGQRLKSGRARQDAIDDLASRAHTYPYIYSARFPISTNPISSGATPYQLPMQITGLFASLMVFMTPINATGSQLYTGLAFSNLQILDGSGNSILGTLINLIDKYVRYAYNSASTDSNFAVNNNTYLLGWSSNSQETVESGLNLGSLGFDVNYAVRFVPAVSSSGNTLYILGQQQATLTIDGSQAIVAK